MLKKIAASALLVTGMCLLAGNVMAEPVPAADLTELQGMLNSVTYGDDNTLGGPSSVNVDNFLSGQTDTYWNIAGKDQGGSAATMMFQFQGSLSTPYVFGVYDSASEEHLTLFNSISTPGAAAYLTINDKYLATVLGGDAKQFASATFGYFLTTYDSSNVAHTVYSNSLLNDNSYDHMLAYQGKGDLLQLGDSKIKWTSASYVLAFEDALSADWNYTDLAVLVSNVSPAPEPATLVLLGTGVAGLTGMVRRRKAKNRYNFNK